MSDPSPSKIKELRDSGHGQLQIAAYIRGWRESSNLTMVAIAMKIASSPKLSHEERGRIREIAEDIWNAHQLGTHRQNVKWTDTYSDEDKALVVRALFLVAGASAADTGEERG